MSLHVAILRQPYLDLILAGAKTVESRLTRTPLPPWQQIEPGERIFFRESCGPYRATAIARHVHYHDQLTPAAVAKLRKRFNASVCGDDAYWELKAGSRYATFVALAEVQATDRGPALGPSSGRAWFVVDESLMPAPPEATVLEVTLTDGALRNRYLRIPRAVAFTGVDGTHAGAHAAAAGTSAAEPGDAARGDDEARIMLVLPDGRTVTTGLAPRTRLLRWRGWGAYFERFRLRAGDRVGFVALGGGRYRVDFHRAGSRR